MARSVLTRRFLSNLAEELDDRELGRLSSELGEFDGNKASRSEWEDAYSKGLELLGYNYEDRDAFRGATGVTHFTAATQFQAQAFNELLPPSGPVRTQVVGEKTKDNEAQAYRVREFMNYYITNVMKYAEFDQMLFIYRWLIDV